MTAVPFPVTSAPGARPQESAGRLVNAYAVKTEQGARGPLKWLRAPGLRELAAVNGRAGYRGFIEINGSVLAALEGRAVLIAKSGSTVGVTDLGALDGNKLITIAKNNATPVANIVAVTEEGAFNLYTDDVPDNFADPDLPQPNSVSGVKGYFAFTIADGRLFASDLNSVHLNSLSFATAPGRLLRGVSYRDEWFVFGDNFCQVYRDAGLTPFPFDLAVTIPIGLAGPHAIAGWEPGFTGTMAWVAQDDIVYKLNGYATQPVSTEDVSRDIAATADKSVLEASVHMSNGNAFWVLTRPGFWSWTLNLTTGTWAQRASYGEACWRATLPSRRSRPGLPATAAAAGCSRSVPMRSARVMIRWCSRRCRARCSPRPIGSPSAGSTWTWLQRSGARRGRRRSKPIRRSRSHGRSTAAIAGARRCSARSAGKANPGGRSR